MDAHRKSWNEQQKEFRAILLSFSQHDKSMALFVQQHAPLGETDAQHSLVI